MNDEHQQAMYSDDSGATLSAPTSAPGASQSQPSFNEELERYKGLYSGSQRSLTQTQKALNEMRARAEALEQQLASIQAEKELTATELGKKLAELTEQIQRVSMERDRYAKRSEIRKKIAAEYPALAPIYDQEDLMVGIENLEGEALDGYLSRFNATILNYKVQAAAQLFDGATPPAPSVQQPATVSSAELLERVMRTKPGTDEYNSLMEAYIRSLSK